MVYSSKLASELGVPSIDGVHDFVDFDPKCTLPIVTLIQAQAVKTVEIRSLGTAGTYSVAACKLINISQK